MLLDKERGKEGQKWRELLSQVSARDLLTLPSCGGRPILLWFPGTDCIPKKMFSLLQATLMTCAPCNQRA